MSENDALLLTPGPTQVPLGVMERMATPVIHHRSHEFRALWRRINERLGVVFGTAFPVLTLASSGTGAMEASIVSLLSRGDTVLSFSAGKWGERYEEIARAYGLNVKPHRYEYGESVGPDDVLRALESNPSTKAVLIALCETSTGALHPVQEIAAITRSSSALLFVDAISGLSCDEFLMD